MFNKELQFHTSCFGNSTVQNKTSDRDYALRVYQGWLLLPFVSTALPLTSLYIIASVRAIRSRTVSRKFSALLVNRAIGDLFACLVSSAAVLYLLISVNNISVQWVTFLNSFFTASFWSGLITYTSIGFLKLYAIVRPFKYKEMVSMERQPSILFLPSRNRIVTLIKLSWAFFAIIMMATMGFTLLVRIEFLANWTGCKVENCLSWMYKVRNIFTILLYFCTLICFVLTAKTLIKMNALSVLSIHPLLFKMTFNLLVINFIISAVNSIFGIPSKTVALIKKAKRRSGTLRANMEQQQRNFKRRYRFPLVKLSLGVGTFAVFHFPYALWMIALIIANNCYFILHYNMMQISLGLIRLFVLIRIILDALIGFMESELRHEVVQLFRSSKPTQRTMPKLSTTTNSGVITSESTSSDGTAIKVNRTRTNGLNENKVQHQLKKKTISSVKIVPKTEDKNGEEQRRRHSERREAIEMDERHKKY